MNDDFKMKVKGATITIRTFQDEFEHLENIKFGVEVILTGLDTQEQANKAYEFIKSKLCGEEIGVN